MGWFFIFMWYNISMNKQTYIDVAEYQNLTGEVVEQVGEEIHDFNSLAESATEWVENYTGQRLVADKNASKHTVSVEAYGGYLDFGVNMLKEGLEVLKGTRQLATDEYSFGNAGIRQQEYVRSVKVDSYDGDNYIVKGYVGLMEEPTATLKLAAALLVQWFNDRLKTADNIESENIGSYSQRYFENNQGLEKVAQLLDQYKATPNII